MGGSRGQGDSKGNSFVWEEFYLWLGDIPSRNVQWDVGTRVEEAAIEIVWETYINQDT